MATRDVFSRSTDTFGGSFSADSARMTFSGIDTGGEGGDTTGLLIQRMDMNYGQQITRLYELGQPLVYYVAGRTQGALTLNRVIGPATIQASFYTKFGDVCQAGSNMLSFTFQTGCDTDDSSTITGRVGYEAQFCVITGLTVGVSAQDMLINESIQLTTSNLIYKGSSS